MRECATKIKRGDAAQLVALQDRARIRFDPKGAHPDAYVWSLSAALAMDELPC